MKKIVFILFIFFVLNINKLLAYSSEPKSFISELVTEAISVLSDKSLSDEKKSDVITLIARENVDIRALGYYTLGSVRKSLDQSVLERYNNLFEKYFLKSLISRLSEYSDQEFEVTGAEQKSANYTIVFSKISGETKSPEIKVNWRVYTKDQNKPLIRDLIVEGLSLAKTQKEEFASILNSNNNDVVKLLDKLKEFIEN
tara:strand:+ start:526 stop:1122 length:597 start_codon:yes stop_codon:yes gene_type:complete